MSAIETALTELSANLRRIEQRHQAVGYKFDRLYDLIAEARKELAAVPEPCLHQIQESATAVAVPEHVKALRDAEARLTLLIERDQHKLLDVVARDACRAALAATPAAAPVVLPEPGAVISEVMELVKDWAQRDLIAVEAGIDTLTEESTDKQHQEAKRLDGEAETAYRAIESKLRALLAGVSAPAAQAVPEFCHVAQRKLKNLLVRGYTVTGYALEKPVDGAQPDRGFINHGGFVGWWWDGQTPQAQAVPHQKLTSEIELVLSDPDSELSPGAQRALNWCLTWVSVPLQFAAPQAQAVERGEVLVTVSGFTGSGKSAIAGEIEIMCRALGLQVEWPDSDSEKHMTHADWIAALEQYKPRVRIVECNVPHSVVKGQDK